jgi:hypothetical protein
MVNRTTPWQINIKKLHSVYLEIKNTKMKSAFDGHINRLDMKAKYQ